MFANMVVQKDYNCRKTDVDERVFTEDREVEIANGLVFEAGKEILADVHHHIGVEIKVLDIEADLEVEKEHHPLLVGELVPVALREE